MGCSSVRAADEIDLLVMTDQRDPVGLGCTIEQRGEARVYRMPYERFNEQLRSQVGGGSPGWITGSDLTLVPPAGHPCVIEREDRGSPSTEE